jgi:hypothetical protein
VGPRYNLPGADNYRTHRNFLLPRGAFSFAQRTPHEGFVLRTEA